jgi:acid phosphatase (class A)
MATAVSHTGCDHGAMFFLRSPSMSLISHPARPLLGLAVAVALAGCAATAASRPPSKPTSPPRRWAIWTRSAVPASLDLVPAPPVAGSAALALDEQVSREARALRGSPRFAQAGVDAELGFPEGANHFSCAADIDVDAVKTPALYRLLERSRIDASAATKAAKNHYQRPRPFMVNGEPTCSPKDEEGLRKNGSTRPATPRSAGPGP